MRAFLMSEKLKRLREEYNDQEYDDEEYDDEESKEYETAYKYERKLKAKTNTYVDIKKIDEWLTQDNGSCVDCETEETKVDKIVCTTIQDKVKERISKFVTKYQSTYNVNNYECGSDGMVYIDDKFVLKTVRIVSTNEHDTLVRNYETAHKVGIGPKIFKIILQEIPITRIPQLSITISKFLMSFICMQRLEKKKEDEDAIITLIKKAALNGMLHGDVSADNIRYQKNTETNNETAFFIDWDKCCFFNAKSELNIKIAQFLMYATLAITSSSKKYEHYANTYQELLDRNMNIDELVVEFLRQYCTDNDVYDKLWSDFQSFLIKKNNKLLTVMEVSKKREPLSDISDLENQYNNK